MTIFTATEENLTALSPQDAVRVFRELLWAEARRVGIPLTNIHITTRTDVPDGGIDAAVTENIQAPDSGLIKSGFTGYQIKAGKTFAPWRESTIKDELFGQKTPGRQNLGEAVRDCLDRQGTYVLVCTAVGLTEPQRTTAEAHLKKCFEICGYSTPKVEVFEQTTLLAFLGRFPSLSLGLKRLDGAQFRSHACWSTEDEMRKPLKSGTEQTTFIANLQEELRKKTDSALHLHVRGVPGIGKTRLVLEATKADDLSPLVIYCKTASRFKDTDLFNAIVQTDNQFCIILVIDECDTNSRSYIWNVLSGQGKRIKLVTIYNEFEEASGMTRCFDVPPLNDLNISAIIQTYGIPQDQADRWPPFCGGEPRAAHIFGSNLRHNPEDLLRSPDTVNAWDRYICGTDAPDSLDVKHRRVVLEYLALFKRFGFGRAFVVEARAVAELIRAADPQITWDEFEKIVHTLRRRKILQGEDTLYITPKLLHIKLWTAWWDAHGKMFDYDGFTNDLPEQLIAWFNEMFQYAKESPVASKTVKMLLGSEGPFQKKTHFIDTPLGSRFFLALTDAAPESALHCLQKTVDSWPKAQIYSFSTGRRNVIWALEKIAMWRNLFPGAARVLLSLAEAENENYINNASGVFAGLFSLGMGKLAPTEAPPEERIPVLEEAFRSGVAERRKLAIKACDAALETRLSRTVGPEYQGLREVQNRWMPQTYGELFHAYRRMWEFLLKQCPDLTPTERKTAAEIFIHRAHGLLGNSILADLVLDTLDELGKDTSNREAILSVIGRVLHYEGDKLSEPIKLRCEQLKRTVTGNDFSSLLRRFVGMRLLEDELDENRQVRDGPPQQLIELAAEAFEHPEKLKPEFCWLLSTEAKNGYLFGYELAKRDVQFTLLPFLLEQQKRKIQNASLFLLGGYFRVLFDKDKPRWEAQLDALTAAVDTATWVPELTWRSGMTDKSAQRVIDLAKTGLISMNHLRMFCLGSPFRDLSEEMFTRIVEYLLQSPDEDAGAIALDFCDFFYLHGKGEHTLPEDLTFRLITHRSLLKAKGLSSHDSMTDFHWSELTKAFIRLYKHRAIDLAVKVFEQSDGGILAEYSGTAKAILTEIASQHPEKIWPLVAKHIQPPLTSQSYWVLNWLQGEQHFAETEEPGALSFMRMSDVWTWVDQDAANRAPLIAHFVPKMPFRAQNQVCPREILARYGQHQEVLSSLTANFYTEGWTGPRSLHYQRKKEELLGYKKDETNDNVIRWVDEYVQTLDREIEAAAVREERENY